MSVVSKVKNIVGQSLNTYHQRVKPTIDNIRFKEEYQGRILDCMVGEVDDNYITTPETDNPIVKLEHSKEGVVKMPTIKGKTLLIDPEGNETDTPAEGCRLVSVGEEEGNKLIILSNNKNLHLGSLELGGLNGTNGNISNNNLQWRTDFILVHPNNVYYAKNNHVDLVVQALYEYDIDKKFIGVCVYGENTTANTRYIKVVGRHRVNATDISNIYKNTNVQVELGNEYTDYVEPQQHKSEILLNEPLRSYNGVYDEIVGNKLIRRIGVRNINNDNISKIGTAKINNDRL